MSYSARLGTSCDGSSSRPPGETCSHRPLERASSDVVESSGKHKLLYRTSGFYKNFGLNSNTKGV